MVRLIVGSMFLAALVALYYVLTPPDDLDFTGDAVAQFNTLGVSK